MGSGKRPPFARAWCSIWCTVCYRGTNIQYRLSWIDGNTYYLLWQYGAPLWCYQCAIGRDARIYQCREKLCRGCCRNYCYQYRKWAALWADWRTTAAKSSRASYYAPGFLYYCFNVEPGRSSANYRNTGCSPFRGWTIVYIWVGPGETIDACCGALWIE